MTIKAILRRVRKFYLTDFYIATNYKTLKKKEKAAHPRRVLLACLEKFIELRDLHRKIMSENKTMNQEQSLKIRKDLALTLAFFFFNKKFRFSKEENKVKNEIEVIFEVLY